MLLSVHNLTVGFAVEGELFRAVDGVSFALEQGKSFCLVGESGCGKSVTALSVPGLLPVPPARILGGQVMFEGKDLLSLPEKDLNRLRGARIGMVFQEPMTSLNPVFTVGEQVAEPLRLHMGLGRTEARRRAVELLRDVGIAEAGQRASDYPHQLSGGMRQRVMIAMAVACNPALLIADEPTTALDVGIQGQILSLLRELRQNSGSSLLMITHNLEVVRASAEYMAVMYAGRIVEMGPVDEVLKAPAHPYTAGLMASRPPAHAGAAGVLSGRAARLKAIPGTVPSIFETPPGCAFSVRCPEVFERCRREMPELAPLDQRRSDARAVLAGHARSCRCLLHQFPLG
ncbi:MAG: ABC transporter ATP-binding protein [Deltaproteobacteria bacterium]|jgi:oligopeptide/dipeptide ABC transporter ATP-binding protein|nr:ABC transporter ATP-binding protein [Deltaproteobacteria bacterium]